MPDFWTEFIETIQSSNITMLLGAGALMFAVIGGLALLSHHYTLSGIKARTVGDGSTAQHDGLPQKRSVKHTPTCPSR